MMMAVGRSVVQIKSQRSTIMQIRSGMSSFPHILVLWKANISSRLMDRQHHHQPHGRLPQHHHPQRDRLPPLLHLLHVGALGIIVDLEGIVAATHVTSGSADVGRCSRQPSGLNVLESIILFCRIMIWYITRLCGALEKCVHHQTRNTCTQFFSYLHCGHPCFYFLFLDVWGLRFSQLF